MYNEKPKSYSSKLIARCSQLIIAAFICLPTLHAQQTTRLNNGWQFLKQDLGSVWEAVRPIKAGDPESLPLWTDISLPHCVNAEDAVDPAGNYYQGPAWYKTQLVIDNPYKNGRTLLHFEGVGQKTEVYVYTTKVGSHVGGYDEWTVDITEAIEAFKKLDIYQKQFKGKIPISIRTDNSRNQEMIPSSLSDFNLYGGIYRYLNLIYNPSVSINKLFVFAEVDKEGKQGKLNIKTRLNNSLNVDAADVSIKVFNTEHKLIKQIQKEIKGLNGDINLNDFIIKNPQLWSPDKPFLYTVEMTVKTRNDSCLQIEKVGFKNAEFIKKGPFILNGKRLLLKGTQRHEDHAGVGAAMTEDMMRTEMIMIKDMGANFIRLAHYQQSRIILNLCDSLGILVWEEIPWCRGGLGGDVYKSQAKRMLTNMIEQHYNHPAIIIWGLGNENDWPGDFPEYDKEKVRGFMTELNQLSHKLDPSRKTAIRRCDFCKDIPDIYSPSIWAGWYRGVYTEYQQSTKEEFDKVDYFIHAEWGGDSHAGRHSENPDKALLAIKKGSGTDERSGDASLIGGAARVSKDGDWSESYICNLFDWHLKEQETMPWLTGTAQWIFKDFSTPIRPDNPVPYVNQKGLVERDFTKKESYYVFQSYWAEKPMAHIYGHTWPVRWGDANELKMIKVYSNCTEAELFLNGKSAGVKKRNSQEFPAAGLRWSLPFIKGENVIKVIAKKGGIVVNDEIRFNYQTDKWGKAASVIIKELNRQNDTATIEIKLYDNNKIQCLDAIDWINFSLTGDGKLIDNLGTSSGARKVQAYNGRAIIKIKLNNGKSVVSAKVDGLPTGFINL